MKMIFRCFSLFLFITLAACGPKPAEEADGKSGAGDSKKYCYSKAVKNDPIVIDGKVVQEMIDYTNLFFTRQQNGVEGVFDYLPAEKDSRRGKFSGRIDDKGKIKAIYVFDQEGETHKRGLIIQINRDGASVKLAELKPGRKKGTLEAVDGDGGFETLPTVDCGSVDY